MALTWTGVTFSDGDVLTHTTLNSLKSVIDAQVATLAVDQTITGNKTFSGTNVHSGTNTHSGTETFTGTVLFTNASAITCLSTTTISLAANADTTLYTVPSSKRCVLLYAVLVAAADTGASVISIGQDSAETDWLPNNTLATSVQYDVFILQPVPNTTSPLKKSYAAGTVIQAKVSSFAGAAGNTIYLFGFLF